MKLYFDEKKYKIAKDLLLDVVNAPNNPEILNLLAKSYMKLKDYKMAAGIFKKLTENYENNHILLCDLANCELNMGEFKNAKEHAKKALMIFPDFEDGLKILKEIQKEEE